MIKYSDSLDIIKSTELYGASVGFGLFTEKSPNFLSSEDFFNFINKKNKLVEKNKKSKDYIRYSTMININIPRSLGNTRAICLRKAM